ncbi:MAG: T9SS type A sorting domain-containing protein [bacterium]
MKKKFIIFFVLLICSAVDLYSQANTWQRIFGGPRTDYSYQFFETKDGNFLLLGEKSVVSLNTGFHIPQTYLMKFDISGNKVWEKYFGDSIRPNYSVSALELPSGNILIPYVNNNIGNLMKIESNGNIIWDKHYPNPTSGFYYISPIDNNKNVLINGDQIGGLSYIPNLSKLDTNGNLFWSKEANDSSFKIGFVNSDLGYYSVGSKDNSKIYFDKRDTSGKLIWKRVQNNPYGSFELQSITPVSPITFISIGKTCSSNMCVLFAIKFDSAGNSVWQKEYFSDTLYGVKIVKTLNNNFAIAGGYNIGKNLLSIIDSLGNVVYKKNTYYNPGNAIWYNYIGNTNDSGFLICGDFSLNAGDYSDILAIKTDKHFNFNTVGIFNNNSIVEDYEFRFETYPNPFNPTINIKIDLKKSDRISIKFFDIGGRVIKSILNQELFSGMNLLTLNVSELNLSSGIYFLEVSSKRSFLTKKLIYLK